MAVTAVQRGITFAVKEPLQAAWELAPQTLITTASVYMVAQFGMAHHILPWWIAVPMAGGFEWTWLRGIATAGKVKHGEKWINLLTWTALITVVAYGILYIFGLPAVGVIPESPGKEWGIVLAIAKVVPIALMGFAAANLHRIHKQEVQADRDKIADRELQRQEDMRREQDSIELERQRKQMELDIWRQAQETKRALRITAPSASKKKPVTIDGVMYESRAAAAKALGISPQAVSKRAK